MGRMITWKTANGVRKGRILCGCSEMPDNHLAEDEYLVALDNGKTTIVGRDSIIEDVATPERERYSGPRFGEGNRVVPDVRTECDVENALIN